MSVKVTGKLKTVAGGLKTGTPPHLNYSIDLDGSNDYLTFPNSSNFAFGSGDFTFEFFVKTPGSNNKFLVGARNAIGGGLHITTGGFEGSTVGAVRYVITGSDVTGTTSFDDNSWHHVAIVRSSSTVSIYVDGTLDFTTTDSNNYTGTGGTWYLFRHDLIDGGHFAGKISNLRVVKGTAVYTSNFTAPTAPLTAIAGTSLLTFNGDTVTDTSGNSVALTVLGGAVMSDTDGPF